VHALTVARQETISAFRFHIRDIDESQFEFLTTATPRAVAKISVRIEYCGLLGESRGDELIQRRRLRWARKSEKP
jgi:hypothetical protein